MGTPLGDGSATIINQPKRANIAIAFPAHDRVHASFAAHLARMVGMFTGQVMGPVPGHDIYPGLGIVYCHTSILPDGRQKIVEVCKKQERTHILWLDTDMVFPMETLHMLLRHGKSIVGANYPSRRPPFKFTAGTVTGEQLITKPDSDGLVEVGHVGFGCVLTEISVYENGGPWFAFDWRKNEDNEWTPVGEDVYFSREVRARGHKIYIDQELSRSIGHTGEFTFTAEEMARIEVV